jgi:UDP-N-acetylmuramate dehydrogenase
MQALSEFCTLRVGGFADEVIYATTEAELIEAVQSADAINQPVLVVGGGSNLVVADDGFRGRVVLVRTSGFTVTADACGGAIVTVQAGQDWDEFVEQCVERDWAGLEALSGIPGTVGATPIQNVGAYGQEVGDWIYRIRTYDRLLQQPRTFSPSECEFGYRDSIFKREPNRYLILDVTFQLRLGAHSAPVMYGELANRLGVEVGKRSKNALVRAEVLRLRAQKGMVLDPVDHDTWSVGSFFTNPMVAVLPKGLPDDAPRWPQLHGGTKLSAAWLVENAGFEKGFGLSPAATLSNKHTLAITNRGSATAADVLELATHIQAGVKLKFGIELEIEPNLVGDFR